MRFGLMAVVFIALIRRIFEAFPTTIDVSAWYSGYGLAVLGIKEQAILILSVIFIEQDILRAHIYQLLRILDYLASGCSIADISRFLAEKSQNELPEALEGWLSGMAAKASAVKGIEQASPGGEGTPEN